jgi:ketosteroid isomerase-like protein
MHPFRAAVEGRDIEAAIALLHDDVVFRSPVVFKPYHGRDAVGVLLRAVFATFEGFRYTTEIDGGDDHALIFEARVGDKQIEGVDLLHTEDGRITQFVVMTRPLQGTLALAEAMRARLQSE